MTAEVVRTGAGLRALARTAGRDSERAVVMTMGALHEGHAALVRAARERVGPEGQVVVTVFVNPLQFGEGEDLDHYPRTLDADVALAGKEGADAVFAPSADEVYPGGEPQVRISAGPMGELLEGAYRPGHFDGVLTVVAKLLHLTAPDVAFFGQKDAQQLALVRRMARDLNFPVEIVGVPTVRESDGLALSSRNRYLSEAARGTALTLSRALAAGEAAAARGAGPAAVLREARDVLDTQGDTQGDSQGDTLGGARGDTQGGDGTGDGFAVDYLALVDSVHFTGVGEGYTGEAVLAVAARVGTTRLIDNVRLRFGGAS